MKDIIPAKELDLPDEIVELLQTSSDVATLMSTLEMDYDKVILL